MGGNDIPTFDEYIGKKRNSPPTFEEFKQTYEPKKPDIPKLETPKPPKPPGPEPSGIEKTMAKLKDLDKQKDEFFVKSWKNIIETINPFDDVDPIESVKKKEKELKGNEFNRFSNRLLDSTTFGLHGYAEGKAGANTDWQKTREIGEGGATDLIATGLGYLVPGTASVKAARGIGLGAKSLKGLSTLQKARTIGKEGAAAGAIFGTANETAQETFHPERQNFKQHLTDIGIDTAAGAVLDPLVHVAGSKVLGRFFKKDKVSKSELDNALKDPNTPDEVKQEILLLESPKVAGYLPEGQKSLPSPKLLNEPFTIDQPVGSPHIEGARREANPYRVKYEQLTSDFNKLQSEGNVPPGLEYETAKEMWSHMADEADPTFERLIELANDRPNPSLQERLSLIKQARKNQNAPVYGIDNITNNLNMGQRTERQPLQYTGKGFNPVLKAEQIPQETQPLNFSRKVIRDKDQFISGEELDVASRIEQALNPKKSGEEFGTKTPSGNQILDGIDVSKLRDIGGFKAYTSDLYRIFEDVFGKSGQLKTIKEKILDPFDRTKGENIDLQKKLVDQLDTEVVQNLGIKPGSKESKLVQQYGEGDISLAELRQKSPNRWQDIVKADKWFRKQYDQLIEQVNAVRAKLYPNNPEKLVPKRKDYYRHFQELNGFEGLRNIFDTPAGIDPSLVGTSEFTQPNSRFASIMQERKRGKYKQDAIGGYLNYVPAASYAIKIDPYVKQFNQLAKELANSTEKSRHLNTFIEFLRDFSKDLAGKTNFLDRPFQKALGRKTFNGIDWLNKRVKSNVILGNVSSALSQAANIPAGVAFAKQHSIKGARDTIRNVLRDDNPINHSDFIKERYGHQIYNKFDTKWFNQPKKFASWMLETVDRIGTSFVWNSVYEKGLAQGVQNPIKYADDATRKLIAGRGIGEVPLAQKSKLVQLIAPFQLEVANLWRVQKDFLKNKDIGGLITLYLAAHLLNKGMEDLRGFGVIFDPIDAIEDAVTEPELTPLERGGRIAGEILSNLPLGQTLANFYPEYGTSTLPTRKELFGDRNPNRFGTGLLIAKGIQDPAAKLLLPYGGNQVQKTIKGLTALYNEGIYNDNKTKLKYPVTPNFENKIKGALFGPSAFDETQAYYDNNRRPLGTKQTKEYEKSKQFGKGTEFYNQVMNKRQIDNVKEKLKALRKNKSLSDDAKQEKFNNLMEKLRNLKNAQ